MLRCKRLRLLRWPRRAMPYPTAIFCPIRGNTSPSVTPPARPAPRGVPVGACPPPTDAVSVAVNCPLTNRRFACSPSLARGSRGILILQWDEMGELTKDGGGSARIKDFKSGPRSVWLGLEPAWFHLQEGHMLWYPRIVRLPNLFEHRINQLTPIVNIPLAHEKHPRIRSRGRLFKPIVWPLFATHFLREFPQIHDGPFHPTMKY